MFDMCFSKQGTAHKPYHRLDRHMSPILDWRTSLTSQHGGKSDAVFKNGYAETRFQELIANSSRDHTFVTLTTTAGSITIKPSLTPRVTAKQPRSSNFLRLDKIFRD